MQVRFYVSEDTTRPPILLSYPASERLGIIEFKGPNEATTPAAIDTISMKKKVTFSPHYTQAKQKSQKDPATHHQNQTIKNKPFQDHSLQNYTTIENKPFQDHSWQHNFINNHSFQNHSSIKDV